MLTKQVAFKRSESLSQVDYRIYIELLKGKVYRGVIFISVQINKSDGLLLDWQGGKLDGITVNGNAVEWKLEDGFITFVGQENLQGQIEIRINFENEYSTTGYGLHSFIDSDDQQYLYSQCEPYHFSKIFPCFDQPDLKGTLKLIAQAPKLWKIISNEKKVEGNMQNVELALVQQLGYVQHKDDYQIQEFQTTKKLSTYLYAIVAGPYEEIKYEELHNGIEMSLFCRVSLKQYLQGDSNEIFKLTKDGMQYSICIQDITNGMYKMQNFNTYNKQYGFYLYQIIYISQFTHSNFVFVIQYNNQIYQYIRLLKLNSN